VRSARWTLILKSAIMAEGGHVRVGCRGFVGGLGGVLLAACIAWAQEQPPAPGQPPKLGTPRVHHTPCELAQAMAERLATKGVIDQSRAQEACQMLAPTMSAADQADFVRCCVQRLTQGAATPPRPQTAPDGRQGT
jgi:hypothetical protein